MKKILPIIILAISLCLSSVENSVMAANVDFAFQQERSNSITVGDKNYSFDWSYNSSTVRFLCENKNGKISVIKNIPVNKFGFPSGCTPSINVCGKYGNYIYFWGSGELDECGFFRISVKNGKLSLIEYGMNYAQMLKKRYIILYGDTGGDY